MSTEPCLKKHTGARMKDVGIEAVCAWTGKSKATPGRDYSQSDGSGDRFMPIDVVAARESACDLGAGRFAGRHPEL